MKLLITGATGFVGRNLLLAALASEAYEEIVVSVRNEEKLRAQLAADGAEATRPRIRITTRPDFADVGPVDHAVHAAGVSFARDRDTYFTANVDATCTLAASLPPATRLLVLSSQSAGGPTPPGHSTRSTADLDEPITLYGQSKLEMERALIALRPNAAIWRPPMILGPRDAATVPLFKMAAASFQIKPGRRPKFYSWIDVDDLVAAILAAVHSQTWNAMAGRPIYTASPAPITDLDLLTTACATVGREARIVRLPGPVLRVLSHVVDAVPSLRLACPTLTRDRSRELYHDRWVIDSAEFLSTYASAPTAALKETLDKTAAWLRSRQRTRPRLDHFQLTNP